MFPYWFAFLMAFALTFAPQNAPTIDPAAATRRITTLPPPLTPLPKPDVLTGHAAVAAEKIPTRRGTRERKQPRMIGF